MITFNFNIRNPWGNKWKNYRCFSGSTLFEHKFWELQFYRSNDLLDVMFQITATQSHSGFRLIVGFFGFNAEFQFYDSRHWDYENSKWETNKQTL